MPRPGDCRAALARIAAEVTPAAGAPVECGWTIVPPGTRPHLQKHVALALKRGVFERQRYEFFAIVGHELRTPITSIRVYLNTVIDTEPGSGAERRFLRRARTETLRLARFVDGMFEFSMLDLSVATADPHCFLDEAIAEARDAVDPHARARSIRLDVAPASPVCVALDSDQCVRVFANLLENAVKYGRECGTVRVTYEHAARASIDVCAMTMGRGSIPASARTSLRCGSVDPQRHARRGADWAWQSYAEHWSM